MTTKLFHRDVYMPAKIKKAGRVGIALRPTAHALTAAQSDRYGTIQIPARIEFTGADVVEAELFGDKVQKLVIRLPYNSSLSVIFVLIPDTGTLKTVWLNRVNDSHKTLEAWRYETKLF